MCSRVFVSPRGFIVTRVVLWAFVLFSFGCVKTIPMPEGQPWHIVGPHAAWSRVLSEYVDEQGRVDFEGLKRDPEDLETWVAYVSEVKPRANQGRFPTGDHVTAFYLDSYNGLAMYIAIRSGLLPRQKGSFFSRTQVRFSGQDVTLEALKSEVVSISGDPRVHFALNGMFVSSPQLPQVPWDGDNLDEQLGEAAGSFFDSKNYTRVDAKSKTVYFSRILKSFEEDFLSESATLIEYVNTYRQEKIPDDYRIKFMVDDLSRIDQVKTGV